MSFTKQKASTVVDFDTAPAGAHAACLIAIIDLGTHTETFQGQSPRDNRKVWLGWEIDHESDGGKGRCVMGREYNVSFTSKSGLRLMIEGWRGKKFSDDEEFDISKLLTKSCLLTIVHESKNDKTYAKISNVGPMPKGMNKIEPSRPTILFDLETGKPFPDADWLPYSFGSKLIDIFNDSHEKKGKVTASANGKQEPVGAGVGADADSFETFD